MRHPRQRTEFPPEDWGLFGRSLGPSRPQDGRTARCDGTRRPDCVLRILEGRWKLVILFHLFGGNVRRFSELRRAIPAVSEKMPIQQLRQMERDGIVQRFVHHQVPPKVEYSLTEWGQALCPALDALLTWVDLRGSLASHEASSA
jgi:DNA-binding HxlR family transcriptional regulator